MDKYEVKDMLNNYKDTIKSIYSYFGLNWKEIWNIIDYTHMMYKEQNDNILVYLNEDNTFLFDIYDYKEKENWLLIIDETSDTLYLLDKGNQINEWE